jgi:hypothetical protein
MPNLIESIGENYFNRRFADTFFLDDRKRPSVVVRAGEGQVTYEALTGSASRVSSTHRTLPYSFFEGLGNFSVPILGWRTRDKGRFLAFFSRNNRSYHRGLSPDNLQMVYSDLTAWAGRSGNTNLDIDYKTKCFMAMKPSFLPFTEGVQKMRDGELLSFAVSPTVAVVPGEEGKLDVYFRQSKAGVVAPDGTVSFDIPLLAEYVGDFK